MNKSELTSVIRQYVPGFGKPRVNNDLRDNAEYQRRRTMSRDEKAITARDKVAENIKKQADRDGRDSTFSDALKKATEIANMQYRRDQEDGKR